MEQPLVSTEIWKEEEQAEDVFIDDLPEYLKCPICLCCLNNPYQTPCGHRFCKDCIIPILVSRNNLCPNDRTAIDMSNTFPDNAVKLQINGLKIRCPMSGCEWVGELSDKSSHLCKCMFVRLACALCAESILRTEQEGHLQKCPQRKVSCKYCQAKVSFAGLDSHISACPEYPSKCPYKCESSEMFTRRSIAAHLQACPRVPVSCSMETYGCHDKVERVLLEQHLMVCMPRHAGQMCQQIEGLQREVKELHGSLAAQKELVHSMEMNLYPSSGQFTWRINNIREKIKFAEGGDVNKSVIYSPSFYSMEAGYKLSLCIYPAGDNNQDFMSLYFVVMKGRFDEILQWPFQRRVYLSLLNTKGGISVTKDIQPDPRLHFFHRPENPRNVGYGYPKFISSLRLLAENSEFVENEAIFIRCRVFD